ncbi:MAG TPA: phosphoribosylglycinamide formyltransferase [Acidobacteriota bacterium]|nr:phosphoribosylglycinamide formyltransferase [Acidobacteriota bacterium]
MKNIAILLSGRGSNFLALSDAIEAGKIPARIGLVISNRPEAAGLQHALDRGYKAICIPSKGMEREVYDQLVVKELQAENIDFICLAGFMRLLSDWFVRQYPQRILNIHPSLLPAFPGVHAQRQALCWGAKVTGCTVHFVDEQLDHGPIILQHPVPVLDDDTEETLSARILTHEHEIYPEALKIVCEGRYRIEGRRVLIDPAPDQLASRQLTIP